MKKAHKIIVWSAFVFYCLVLLYIFILHKCWATEKINVAKSSKVLRPWSFFVLGKCPIKTFLDDQNRMMRNWLTKTTAMRAMG